MAPGGTWRCLVRRDIHAPHLRADAMPRTPELALASEAKGRGYMECSSCGSKKLCTPRADGASVLLREVVFEKRAFKLDF